MIAASVVGNRQIEIIRRQVEIADQALRLAGAFASEPCPAFVRRIEAAHSVEVGELGLGEGVREVEKCVHAPIVQESGSESRFHSALAA